MGLIGTSTGLLGLVLLTQRCRFVDAALCCAKQFQVSTPLCGMPCAYAPCCDVLCCRADDDVDRQALVRQQNKVAALEAQLAALKVSKDTHANWVCMSMSILQMIAHLRTVCVCALRRCSWALPL
jgi:hypothetical protein